MSRVKTVIEEEYLAEAGDYFQRKEYDKAKTLIQKVLKIFPHSPEAYYNYGLILAEQKEYQKAIISYKKAAKLMPEFELARVNLGVIYVKSGQLDLALKVFLDIVKDNPESHDGLFNLGLVLEKKNEVVKALDVFRKAVVINPNYAHSYLQMGSIIMSLGKLETALHFFLRAINIDPTLAPAQAAIGAIYTNIGKLTEAKEALEKSEKLGIDPALILETQYMLARDSCDWKSADTIDRKIKMLSKDSAHKTQPILEPLFTNIARVDDPKINLEIAIRTAESVEKYINKVKVHFAHYGIDHFHKRIRVGYLSHDFHNHPVTSQIVDLFKFHNKNKFEVFAYSYGVNDNNPLRRKIENSVEHFIDLENIDHQGIADRIHKDKIDILIDLVGFTGFHRQDIPAYRPAPIQINYLGFPGTTGANYIDYIIVDKDIVPPGEQKFYTEKVLYMPDCYQICSPQIVSRQKFTRKDFGLPENSIVFGSFNRHSKIDKKMFDTWIRVMKRVPDSVLWIYVNQELARKNLREYFERSGLVKDRLIFAGKMPLDKHLARLKLLDIGFDTYIYSGGATTANMLWAGVPVITIYGKHYLSRMSSSILKNIGMSELICKDTREYEKLAIDLATQTKKISEIRSRLQNNKNTFPLFNSKLFTQNLEILYEKVFQDYRKRRGV